MVEGKELQEMEKMISPVLATAMGYKVSNEEEAQDASVFLRKVKDLENTVEAKRLSFTKPLNESLKNINDTFRMMREPLEKARGIVTNVIMSWKRLENARIAAEEEALRKQKQAEAEKRAKEILEMAKSPEPIFIEDEIIEAPKTIVPLANKIGNVQTRKTWTYEVVDFTEVPDSFKVINPGAVTLAIRGGTREIPGLRIYQAESLSVV